LRKVNRCLTEGRRSFLERYAGIESGAECERWMPVISAMVDGEATPEEILELRPHLRNCPGCRATLKALHESSAPLSAVLPIPLAVAANGGTEHISNLFIRAYEAIAGGVHERAVHSVTKAQAAMEAAAAGKVAAVAASAAAVAGGGYATVERTVRHERAEQAANTAQHDRPRAPKRTIAAKHVVSSTTRGRGALASIPVPRINEFGQSHPTANTKAPSEFGGAPRRDRVRAIAAAANGPAKPRASTPTPKPTNVAPEFASSGGGNEFGP
jgi:hypothetical protein